MKVAVKQINYYEIIRRDHRDSDTIKKEVKALKKLENEYVVNLLDFFWIKS